MSSSTAATTPLPKTMSSRLLTMKFMQRAAATSSPTASPSPSSGHNTPVDVPSPKRRKTDRNSSYTPTKFDVSALADQRAVQAAAAQEEAKRQIAIERQANEAGDTRWVLSFEEQWRGGNTGQEEGLTGLRVVQMGFADVDSSGPRGFYKEESDEEEEDSRQSMIGRRSFGAFNKRLEKSTKSEDSSDSNSSDEDDNSDQDGEEEEAEDDDPTSQLIRDERTQLQNQAKMTRKAARRAEKAALEKASKQRREKEVNLNGLSSLSGRQDTSRPPPVCFRCKGPHIKSQCPELNGRKGKRRFDGDNEQERGGQGGGKKRKVKDERRGW